MHDLRITVHGTILYHLLVGEEHAKRRRASDGLQTEIGGSKQESPAEVKLGSDLGPETASESQVSVESSGKQKISGAPDTDARKHSEPEESTTEMSEQERRLAESGISVPKASMEFPAQLMDLLQREVAPDAMRFLPEGEAIAFDMDTFADRVLNVHFRAMKFNSFVRNMNRYGFRRISHPSLKDSERGFHHLLFKRNSPELVKHMKKDSNATEVVRQLDLADSVSKKKEATKKKGKKSSRQHQQSSETKITESQTPSKPELAETTTQTPSMVGTDPFFQERQQGPQSVLNIAQQRQFLWQSMMMQQQFSSSPHALGLMQHPLASFAGNPMNNDTLPPAPSGVGQEMHRVANFAYQPAGNLPSSNPSAVSMQQQPASSDETEQERANSDQGQQQGEQGENQKGE